MVGSPGEGVGDGCGLTWVVLDFVVEFAERQCPACLALVAVSFVAEEFECVVVGVDVDGVGAASDPMSPFLEGVHYCEEFLVVDRLISFRVSEFMRYEGDGSLGAFLVHLREFGSNRTVGCIGLEGVQ